jgi:FixJ family two-component response regulator
MIYEPPRRFVEEPRVIHIVEDDAGVSDSIAMLLQQLGHVAVTHPDAESLFEHTPPGPSDVILVDLALPGISGATLIRWLARLQLPPRIIAMSGQPFALIERELGGVAFERLLRKPLTADAITSAI